MTNFQNGFLLVAGLVCWVASCYITVACIAIAGRGEPINSHLILLPFLVPGLLALGYYIFEDK